MAAGIMLLAANEAKAQGMEIAWERMWDGGIERAQWGDPLGLVEADDGGLIAAVSWISRLRIFKFNRLGEIVWDQTYERMEGLAIRDCRLLRIGRDRTIVFLNGSSWNSLRFFCINDDGETVWNRSYDFDVRTGFHNAFIMDRDSVIVPTCINR